MSRRQHWVLRPPLETTIQRCEYAHSLIRSWLHVQKRKLAFGGHPGPPLNRLLPVIPATALGAAYEKAEQPKDQPDDEQNPEDVKRWCKQTAPTEKQ